MEDESPDIKKARENARDEGIAEGVWFALQSVKEVLDGEYRKSLGQADSLFQEIKARIRSLRERQG